jgi:hypothetical protein
MREIRTYGSVVGPTWQQVGLPDRGALADSMELRQTSMAGRFRLCLFQRALSDFGRSEVLLTGKVRIL